MERMVLISSITLRRGETVVGNYFDKHPEVVQIFTDLEKFESFCRFEGYKFDEKDLYKKDTKSYSAFLRGPVRRRPRRKFKKRRYN